MAPNEVLSTPPRWSLTASIWGAFALIDALQTVTVMQSEGMHHAWAKLFTITVLSWLPWAAVTPLILRLGRHYPPVKLRPYVAWPVHVAACASIALLFSAWTAWLHLLTNPYGEPPPPAAFVPLWADKFENGILTALVLYAGILTAGFVSDSRDRIALQRTEAARLSEQLAAAQLDALRRQIEPHFLFNALNAVAGVVRDGQVHAAVNTIAALSDFLRRMLDESNRQEVSLKEELEFVCKYLDIQKIRFAERLTIDIDIATDLYPASVPRLILQPLVENAVKHGIEKRARGGTIRIAASNYGEMLRLSVGNDGPSLPADWSVSPSAIGMSNVRKRLCSLYGDAFELRMENRQAGGVEVVLSVPLRGCPLSDVRS